jgi:hypothetical protein
MAAGPKSSNRRGLSTCLLLLMLSMAVVWILASYGDDRRPRPHDPGDEQHINLLAIADWGMIDDSQRAVASAMRRFVSQSTIKYQGVLCGGDNIYVPLRDVHDPTWKDVFEGMYDIGVINFPFYIAPGNHDYEEGKLAIELAYAKKFPHSRWKMPAPYFRVDLPAGSANPLVSVLVLDSDRDQMGLANWAAELLWIDRELSKPRKCKWLVAIAHHPLFSNGSHGDNGVLQNTWGPRFREHGVDLYICGHDHDMQHLEVDGWSSMSFALVGGGGAQTREMRVDRRGPFSKSMHGFAELRFTPESLVVSFVDVDGQIAHSFRRTADKSVTILKTTPSDVAVPRTPRSITRPDTADLPPKTGG